ncbi:MAG: hypothetical protein J6T94_08565 [Bacteroidaceae bacterium]|nr:hypothetical protein [Bacteroidaceae bacterium]
MNKNHKNPSRKHRADALVLCCRHAWGCKQASAPSLPNSIGLPSDGNASGKKNPASLENPMQLAIGFFGFSFIDFRGACNALCVGGEERGSLLPTGSTSGAQKSEARESMKGFFRFLLFSGIREIRVICGQRIYQIVKQSNERKNE